MTYREQARALIDAAPVEWDEEAGEYQVERDERRNAIAVLADSISEQQDPDGIDGTTDAQRMLAEQLIDEICDDVPGEFRRGEAYIAGKP